MDARLSENEKTILNKKEDLDKKKQEIIDK